VPVWRGVKFRLNRQYWTKKDVHWKYKAHRDQQ
jgi:hypothetical protein